MPQIRTSMTGNSRRAAPLTRPLQSQNQCVEALSVCVSPSEKSSCFWSSVTSEVLGWVCRTCPWCMCVCVCVRVCVCVCLRVYVLVRVCVGLYVSSQKCVCMCVCARMCYFISGISRTFYNVPVSWVREGITLTAQMTQSQKEKSAGGWGGRRDGKIWHTEMI